MPQLNMAAAIELYYSQNDLSTADIMRIFGCSRSYARTRKLQVQRQAAAEQVCPVVFDANSVNAEYAFRVWGLDVEELESKYAKWRRFCRTREKEE